jgi:hypothetical protein
VQSRYQWSGWHELQTSSLALASAAAVVRLSRPQIGLNRKEVALLLVVWFPVAILDSSDLGDLQCVVLAIGYATYTVY